MDALASVSVPGWTLEYVDATPSTNLLARDRPAGTVVVADHQTAGRGRLDRTWETPAGVALTFSAVVDPRRPDARWPWLPLLAGVVVGEAVVGSRLKWPNDVLLGGRKLVGILVERTASILGSGPLAVIGIGLNVHQTELPVPSATSLALEGLATDRAQLLATLLAGLTRHLDDWRSPGGDDRLRAAYLALCDTVGRQVAVELPGDAKLLGEAVEVDEHGRLVVETTSGRHAVGAGDVVHVRAGDG